MFYWILLGLIVMLFMWAAWRQKRYRGTTVYDRESLQDERWHHSDHHPWGISRTNDDNDHP
jgi:hypothetical protein